MCKLKRALYGLKQSPRVWQQRATEALLSAGYTQCKNDPTIFFKCEGKNRIILLIYVDDILAGSTASPVGSRLLQGFIDLFTKTFKVKDLGDAKKFLGLHVQQDLASGTVRLDQSHYALEVVKEYLGDNRISHRPQPMSPDFRVLESDSPSTDEEKKETSQFPYRQLLGSLMYLMVGTRFDIAYAVSQLARVMSNPGVRHWHALKYLLRYVARTTDFGIIYTKDTKNFLVCHADASWGGSEHKRRSVTGYDTTAAGGAIGWKSGLQSLTAMSSLEAELIAAWMPTGSSTSWMNWVTRWIPLFRFTKTTKPVSGRP